MQSRSDFWLVLHQLVNELEREGKNNDERVPNIIKVMRHGSPTTQQFYRQNVMLALEALNALALAFNNDEATEITTDEK